MLPESSLSPQPQAWCPLGGVAYPAWGNSFTAEDEKRIAGEFRRQSEKYGAQDWVIVLAWLLAHPSGINPIIGTTTRDALVSLDEDDRTESVVMIGEIGGAMEEDAADYANRMSKPIVAFIAGAASPPGKRMGHAGAIVMGNRGTYAAKKAALEGAGVAVLPTPGEIGTVLRERMG